MADRVGQQLGNYRLVGVLGSGSFADVYLAEHIHLGTQAAIKVLKNAMSPEDLRAFEQEAHTIASFGKQPHIVQVLDYGVDRGGTPYLVMEYASGGTLRQKHPKGTPVPLGVVVSYVRQLAEAVQFAHDHKPKRVIHRDIKPENILLNAQGDILLSDFGIAVLQSTYNSTTQAAGTALYMAPEQITRHPVPASDQYSLAVVVYEWLAGGPPFEGTMVEVIGKHLKMRPPSLRKKAPTLPREVARVVSKALAKNPKHRFPTIQKFAAALEQATLPPDPNRTRRRILVGALALGLVAVAGGLGVGVWEVAQGSQANAPSTATPTEAPTSTPTPTATPSPTPTPSPTATPTPPPFSRGVVFFVYLKHNAWVNGLALSPNGARMASASWDHTAQVWDVADGNNPVFYRGHNDKVNAVVWSPAGKYIASAGNDHTVQVWDAASGVTLFIYRGHRDSVLTVDWSPDGQRIASGSADGTVQVWNATDGSLPLVYQKHNSLVETVAWSPDGKRIASGSADHTVQVWDADNRADPLVYRGHNATVFALAWSPDGKLIASGSGDHTVQVWDAANDVNAFIYRGHTDAVYAVAWSPDGKLIASGSADQTAQVWGAANGGNAFQFRGHAGQVAAVVWLQNGQRVASGGADSSVRVWEAR